MRWVVTLTGQDTGREYVYHVASLREWDEERVLLSAVAEHGRMILLGAVAECVEPSGTVTKVTPPGELAQTASRVL